MRTPTKKFSNGPSLLPVGYSSKSSSFTNLYCELHHDILNWGSAHHNIYSRASS
ncbi:hypothetical protein CK203_038334 [Vitis vinifera]|uniref:Uncharacterized protein n=1 Tax=Vitis vinifera TaxID=29760 RepID=A0A438HEQ7_VITVI|nr:hypothetical protein CK203_038334 [Vitis vinifera]